VRKEKTARTLAEEFVALHEKRFAKAVSVFEAGIGDALTYPRYPGSHHARIRTTNERAGEVVRGGEAQDEGSWGVPQRDQREHASDGDHAEEQRGMAVEALPDDGCPQSGRKTKPTTFETLTNAGATGGEFLYDSGRDECRCLSSKTPLVRYPEVSRPVEQLPVMPPLRILKMVASPPRSGAA